MQRAHMRAHLHSRRKSTVMGMMPLAIEEPQLDYDQLEGIPPLPLYALLAADTADETAAGGGEQTSPDQVHLCTRHACAY